MKRAIKLEELAMFGLSMFLFSFTDYPWWLFLALILLPDIGMIGYLIDPKVGSVMYNIFHHKGIAIAIYISGYFFELEVLELSGLILFGHSSMDRIFGYGLKYPTGFNDTHLGQIG